MAPDFETLEQRLRKRGTDAEETIRQRMKNAEKEIQENHWYDHVIKNDDLGTSIKEMADIFERELR